MAARTTELGCAGHLIVAHLCHWRRHTQVGDRYRVSTVGDYRPTGKERGTVGAGDRDFFETMVFRTSADPDSGSESCGCHAVSDWCEVATKRYATAGEAQAGHEAMVAKYAAMEEGV